jgi:glycosyltransferase involved in cell wall biosynthesis
MGGREETNTPKVSVLLPNYNYRRFLKERIQTILDQTFSDWELVIVDSYSNDGAWELIQEFAAKDSRIQISQAPREGIYAGLNRCIRLARGEYVYVATSDDTMLPDCLEKMVAALEQHPKCDLCHTCLRIIDEEGKERASPDWRQFQAARFYGDFVDKFHIRFAPYDGILHCALYMVYSSLTQLLIRRTVFEKVGLFRTDQGSIADFEWGMRAALVCNILHLPETLATWRVHPAQATSFVYCNSADYRAKLCEMIKSALPILREQAPEYYKRIRLHRLLLPYRRSQLMLNLEHRRNRLSRLLFLLQFIFVSPMSVAKFVFFRLTNIHNDDPDNFVYIRKELKRLGLDQFIKVIEYEECRLSLNQ